MVSAGGPRRRRRGAHGLRDLYKGQCNDPYWHGVFGGLYLPHLREAVLSPPARGRKDDAGPAGLEGPRLRLRRPGRARLSRPDLRAPGQAVVRRDPRRDRLPSLVAESLRRPHPAPRVLPPGAGSRRGRGGDGQEHPRARQEAAARGRRAHALRLIPAFLADRPFLPPRDDAGGFPQGRFRRAGGFRRRRVLVRGLRANAPAGAPGSRLGRGGERPGRRPQDDRLLRRRSLRVDIEIENLSGKPLALTYGSEWNFLAFPHEIELLGADGAALYGGAASLRARGSRRGLGRSPCGRSPNPRRDLI